MKAVKIIICLILLIGGTIFYAYSIEPNMITSHEYKIKIDNLPDNFDGFKIVHVSDILYGDNINLDNLKDLVDKINDANPDIIVLTGDLINNNYKITTDDTSKISEILKNLNSKSGKYAITGDNDYKLDEWQNIIKNSGFINLNNNYDTIYKNGYEYLFIAGASSAADKESINDKLKTSIEYLNSKETNGPLYKILIMHEPDYINDLTSNPFNLILAGHSLGGEVKIPLYGGLFKKSGSRHYFDSYYKIKDSDLYVSNGIGTEKSKFRLFNTPSFNVYRLVK